MEDHEYQRILGKINDLEREASFASFFGVMDSVLDVLANPPTLQSELTSVLTALFRNAMKCEEHSEMLRACLGDYGWSDGRFQFPIADPVSLRERMHLVILECTLARRRRVAEKLTMEEVERFLSEWEPEEQTEERKQEVLRRLNEGDVNVLVSE
jgi:hypothetical protein